MIKHHLTFLILVTFLLSISVNQTLQAVTAYPYPIIYTQPDGSQLTIFLKGDEKTKWAETNDGYSLLFNNNGYYEYAILNTHKDMVPSGIIAKDISQRSVSDNEFLAYTQKKLSYSATQISLAKQAWDVFQGEKSINAFPTTGNRKLICILIGFTDRAFSRTKADFENLFNQIGYTTDGAYGSVKDFYLENSYNQLNLTVTVAGPYTASNTMAYYGANDTYGNDMRRGELVTEAVTLADPDVNYADFDNDNDGVVEGVYVIYAGYGEESGGGSNPNAIWAYNSHIPTVTFDGKSISEYSCSSELRGNSGNGLTRIGVICHEFGHILGAPDYYDTDYGTNGQYPGTGNWDVMANGSWNMYGAVPAHHNAYTKCYVYNWATAKLLSASQKVNVFNAVQDPNSFYRYNTTTTNEYFLCENRQPIGFDIGVPGHGLIIYHVDGAIIALHSSNNIINADSLQGMFPMSAVSTTANGVMKGGNVDVSGCPWPGTGLKTQFTDATIPNSKSRAGANTSMPLTNISEDFQNNIISFCISGCSAETNPTNFTANTVNNSQINLSWILHSSYPVMLVCNSMPVFGTPVNGTAYSAGNTIQGGGTVLYCGSNTSFNHINLGSGTKYYYRIFSVIPTNIYSDGLSKSALTDCESFTLPFTESFSGTEIPSCWTQSDHQNNGKLWQSGIISGNGSPALSGNYAYLNSDAYGSGVSENTDLITPALDLTYFTGVNLTFNHYFLKYASGESGTLSYSINNGSTWTVIQSFTATTTNPALFNQNISAVDGHAQVKFKWNYTSTWGYFWAIDNISITGNNINDRLWTGTINSDWNNAGNWSGGIPVDLSDITIPTGTPNMLFINTNPSNPATCHNLTLNNGAHITVNAGKALTVNGVCNNNGLITIKSDITGTGSFVNKDAITGSGSAVVEKYLPSANTYGWFICSPVVEAGTALFTGATGVYYYNPLTTAWDAFNTGFMQTMLGYATKFAGIETLAFSGSLNSGTKSFSNFYRTAYNSGNCGWNLIGNPFPSAIDWEAVVNLNGGYSNFISSTKLNTAVYISDSVGGYHAYNNGYGTGGFNGIVPSSTAFWIQVNKDFTDPGEPISGSLLTLNNTLRVHQTYSAKKSSASQTLRLLLEKGIYKDEAVICMKNTATLQFDPNHDALKMFSDNMDNPQIYSIADDNEKLSINAIPEINTAETVSIPIGYICNSDGYYIIEALDFSDIGDSINLYFEDLVENKIINLRQQNSYSFHTNAGTYNARFIVLFAPIPYGIATVKEDLNPIQIYAYNNAIYISSANEKATVIIYNMLGQQVISQSINAGSTNKININLPSAYYIVKVVSAKNSAISKVFVK